MKLEEESVISPHYFRLYLYWGIYLSFLTFGTRPLNQQKHTITAEWSIYFDQLFYHLIQISFHIPNNNNDDNDDDVYQSIKYFAAFVFAPGSRARSNMTHPATMKSSPSFRLQATSRHEFFVTRQKVLLSNNIPRCHEFFTPKECAWQTQSLFYRRWNKKQ
jgi:hypothetical protein